MQGNIAAVVLFLTNLFISAKSSLPEPELCLCFILKGLVIVAYSFSSTFTQRKTLPSKAHFRRNNEF